MAAAAVYEAQVKILTSQKTPNTSPSPMPKRIIICCDGTWQSSVSGQKNVPSNVTRLCRALNRVGVDKDGKEWQQVVWYDSGIGTESVGLGEVIQGATGEGLEGNVVAAYNFCVLNYHPGDQIMCFGFSRGAYTARTIAGLISDIGICSKSDLNEFPDLWAIYKKVPHGKRFHRSDLWYDWIWGKADEHQGAGDENHREFVYEKPPQGDWAQEGSRNVEVVGVYDTVGALGMPEVLGVKLPSKEGWYNVGLSPSKIMSPLFCAHPIYTHVENSSDIKHAFHALALDERRKAFSPTLWYLSDKTATQEDVEARKEEEIQAEKNFWAVLENAKALKAGGKATDEQVNAAARNVNLAAKAWNKATRKRVKYQNRLELHPDLKQVWFPGCHVNIGGGSSDTLNNEGDMEEMANITFSWMLDQIKEYLSIDNQYIADEQKDRERHLDEINLKLEKWDAAVNPPNIKSWKGWPWRHAKATLSALVHRLTPGKEPAFKGIRVFGWGIGHFISSYTPMYWANGSKKRTPGQYALEAGKTLGSTFESIHPVVNFRMKHFAALHQQDSKNDIYRPIDANLKFERQKILDSEGNPMFVYEIGNSGTILPEWKLGGVDCYERLAIAGEGAYAYVDELDEQLKTGIRTIRRSADPIVDTPIESSLATISESLSTEADGQTDRSVATSVSANGTPLEKSQTLCLDSHLHSSDVRSGGLQSSSVGTNCSKLEDSLLTPRIMIKS
ncbi:hypothetical protein N7462_010656 [Penicillium macrosclerotiorum]|uniref:uncharacterized protein n=1 Tax=Penicillium macrosclerotiorum TaxID=303699 RepID=UPI002548087C|nr:uncharacterized protein N7462_010656 [Penicillium macrosclerotiorum]KAJ5669586.1 hypothetical protein N7462_010656 [Penicillium macrosclerotiorum]